MTSVTFFLDGSAKVCDQHGRPIKGTVVDGKTVRFADVAPESDRDGGILPRAHFASHRQVIEALEAERVDLKKVVMAGWPQLPYEELKKLPFLPPTPLEELRKIPDRQMRKDALRIKRETATAAQESDDED